MPNLTLTIGSYGEEVRKLHQKLIKRGLEIPSDELDRTFFGPATRYIVLGWQRENGLPMTGIVDEQIAVMLELRSATDPSRRESSDAVSSAGTRVHGIAARDIFAPEVSKVLTHARTAAKQKATREIRIHGVTVSVPYPFPSPTDWRDCWMYFLMLDRFANHAAPPKGPWNQRFDYRQGGTFRGITNHLDYLHELGVKALWLTPVLKNPRPDWQFNYHGYNTQDFLSIDERFGSDGTPASAERELDELILHAHGRGIFVILDMVINHAAQVFNYVYHGRVTDRFADGGVMDAPLGEEPPIQWLNGYGYPRADWQDQIPPGAPLSPDDAVYPADLQQKVFFRRRGDTLSYALNPQGFIKGDFIKQRQLVVEYDATPGSQATIRDRYGVRPVLNILIQAYQYLIAKFDFDGFRIDTTKHISQPEIETFGNAIREFAQTLGKRNFFTFGEIYDNEETINRFVGRHSPDKTGFGIDAALDYPLFFTLTDIVRGWRDVADLPAVFQRRKEAEETLISSHGEAGQYFVTFLDNHDQFRRFNLPSAPQDQIAMGLAVLFCLQGIPAIYYGTEQGLKGTVDQNGNPDLISEQSVREALWGQPNAFDRQSFFFTQVKALGRLREEQSALRFGRLYFRQISGNKRDFGHSSGCGGLLAFSRVLSDVEVLVVANTSPHQRFEGLVIQDPDLNRGPRRMQIGYADVAALAVNLAPMEVQVWVPL